MHVKKIGHKHGTKTKELIKVLKIKQKRLTVINSKAQLPNVGVLKVSYGSGNWHWVVKYYNQILDPIEKNKIPIKLFLKNNKVTSYLEYLPL